MHPYSVAKMVTSLAFLHGRRVYLNMVAGGFTSDLAALNDRTPHDERYARLAEYTAIVQGLLQSADPLSFTGSHYQVHNLRLTPPLPRELLPGILMSGSSEAGVGGGRGPGGAPRPAARRCADEQRPAPPHGRRPQPTRPPPAAPALLAPPPAPHPRPRPRDTPPWPPDPARRGAGPAHRARARAGAARPGRGPAPPAPPPAPPPRNRT